MQNNEPQLNEAQEPAFWQTHVIRWAAYPAVRPKDYGRYLVYRAGCRKMHFETWNNTGWAYNNRDITHWTDVEPPIA